MVRGGFINGRQITEGEGVPSSSHSDMYDEPVQVIRVGDAGHHHAIAGPERPSFLKLVDLGLEGKRQVVLQMFLPSVQQRQNVLGIDTRQNLVDVVAFLTQVAPGEFALQLFHRLGDIGFGVAGLCPFHLINSGAVFHPVQPFFHRLFDHRVRHGS